MKGINSHKTCQFYSLELTVLAFILLTALYLRLWGGFFGLPHIYHTDEGFEVYRAVRLGMGEYDLTRQGKGGYYYLLFLEYGVYFLLSLITGAVSSVWDFAMEFVRDPSPFWKIGRVTTAVLGTCTVLLVWWQGRRMGGPWSGLLGAWFLALSFRHILYSHYITVDVPMALFAFWSVVMVVEDVEGRQRLNPFLFPIVAAFAVLNKLPAAVLFVPYFLASLMRGGIRGDRGLLSRATLLPAIGTGVIYLVANPGFIRPSVLNRLIDIVTGYTILDSSSAFVEHGPNLWVFYFSVLRESEGLVLLALALLGIGVGLAARRLGAVLHLAFLLPFFLLIAMTPSFYYYKRYVIPFLPGLCLFAGMGLESLIRRIQVPRPAAFVLGSVLAGLVTLGPGLTAVRFNQKLTRVDTRTLTVEWIENNIPHESRILLEGFPEDSAQLSVPLKNIKKNIRAMVERLQKTDPGKAKYLTLKRQIQTGPAYDLMTVQWTEDWGTLEYFRGQRVQYVVVNQKVFLPEGRTHAAFPKSTVQTRIAFYQQLRKDNEAELLVTFDPADTGGRGYLMEVWRLAPANGSPLDMRSSRASRQDGNSKRSTFHYGTRSSFLYNGDSTAGNFKLLILLGSLKNNYVV